MVLYAKGPLILRHSYTTFITWSNIYCFTELTLSVHTAGWG